MSEHVRHFVGCMTGTSLDAIDVALIRITGSGLAMQVRLLATHSEPLGPLAAVLEAMAEGRPTAAVDWLRTARRLGQRHAAAIEAMLAPMRGRELRLDCVAAHGQTVWHAPAEALSWQLFDPWPIVRRLGVPVVYDMRQADLVAGGEAAPITPMADWVLFRHSAARPVVVNLGGICNITILPRCTEGEPEDAHHGPVGVSGRDVGPCNLLLDGLVQRLVPGVRFDEGGARALRGRPCQAVIEAILAHPDLAEDHRGSTGRERFNARWLDELAESVKPRRTVEDVLAGAVAAVAHLIRRHVPEDADMVILAGGGVRNEALVGAIGRAFQEGGHDGHGSTARVVASDELGIPAGYREAVAMAVLGALCEDGIAITLPGVTGAAAPGVAGTWAGLAGPKHAHRTGPSGE